MNPAPVIILPPVLARRKNQVILGLIVLFFIVVPGTLMLVYVNSQKAANQRLEQQAKAFESPDFSTKRQIRKISLKRKGENGDETIEITFSGKVLYYDAFGNLIKSGLMGFADVQSLFDRLNRDIDKNDQSYFGSGNYTLIIETSSGTTVIEVTDDGNGDSDNPIEDIIDDIEDIIEETLYPTPTLVPPPTIYNPNVTPSPILIPTSNLIATPTPTLAPGAPTPLPAYMLAPTFTCEEVYSGGKPLPVSNTVCGFDPNVPR